MNRFLRISALIISTIVVLVPHVGYAYGGPGSVISGIGALLAAVAALLASLFGFIWFPLKRLYLRMSEKGNTDEEEE